MPALHARRNVLLAMADPSALDSEARKPGVGKHTRDVHGTVLNRIFPREEAVYSVQCSLPGRGHTHLL